MSGRNPQFPILDKYFNVSRNLDDSGVNPLGMDSRFEGDWLSMSTSKVFQHLEPTIAEENYEKESNENNNNAIHNNHCNNSHLMTLEEINTSVNTVNTINTVSTNNNTATSPYKVQGQLIYLNNTTLNGTTFRKSKTINSNNNYNNNNYSKRVTDNNNSLDDIDPEDHLMNMRETSTQTVLSAASWPEVNIVEGKVNIVANNITNYSAGSASTGSNASPSMLGRPPLAPLSPRIPSQKANTNNGNSHNNYPHSSPYRPLDLTDLQTEEPPKGQKSHEPEQLEPEEKPFVMPQHIQQEKNYSNDFADTNLKADNSGEEDACMWRSVASYGGHDTTVDHTALVGSALTPTSKKRGKQTPGPLFQHSPGLSPISSQREKAKAKGIQEEEEDKHSHKLVINQEVGGIDTIGFRTNKGERVRNIINGEEVDLSIISTEVEADMEEGSVRSASSLKDHKGDAPIGTDADVSLSIASMSLVDAETSVLTASSAGTQNEYARTIAAHGDKEKDGYVSGNSVDTSNHSTNSSHRNDNLHKRVESYAHRYGHLSGSAVTSKDETSRSGRSKGISSPNLHVPYYAASVGPPSAGRTSSSSTSSNTSRSRSRHVNNHSSNNGLPPMGIQLGWLGAFSRTFPGSGRVSVYGSLMSGPRVNLSFTNRLHIHSHPSQHQRQTLRHRVSRASNISPTSPTTKYWRDRLQQSFLSSYS